MKKPDDLFQLVKSLSKSEKRYFKLHASIHKIGSENIYVRLFDAFDKMIEYDEGIIRKKFEGEKFVSTLFSTKNYLFNIILKILTEYYSAGSQRQEVNKIVDEFLILMDKGMYLQAEKKLKKAKAISIQNEMFELVLDILQQEQRLINRFSYSNKRNIMLEKNKNEEISVLAKLNNYNSFIYVYNRLADIWQKDKEPDREDEKWLNLNVFKNPLFQSEKNILSKKGGFIFFRTLHIASEIKFEDEKSYKYLSRAVVLAGENMELIENFSGQYIQSLSNLISFEISFKRFTLAEENIKKLKGLSDEHPNFKRNEALQSVIFYYIYYLQLALCIESLGLERGISYIKEIESKLKEYQRYVVKYKVMQFYFFFAYLYYLKSDFDNSLKWLNRILNENADDASPEIMSFSRILRLLVHYEKNDFDLLEYLIKSSKRFFEKNRVTFKYERLFLDFLQKALNLEPVSELKALMTEFKINLVKLSKDSFENNAIENLDLITWAESKIQGRVLADLLREKLEKNKK